MSTTNTTLNANSKVDVRNTFIYAAIFLLLPFLTHFVSFKLGHEPSTIVFWGIVIIAYVINAIVSIKNIKDAYAGGDDQGLNILSWVFGAGSIALPIIWWATGAAQN